MDNLLKLVRTYRLTEGLAERLRLAEDVFRLIEPDLRFFVFGLAARDSASDVLQETLKAIAVDLSKFRGDSPSEFWAWAYRIARHKVSDSFRKKAADRLHPIPPEEMWQLVESSAETNPISPGDRHDLEYAMEILTKTKPECFEYLWRHFVFGLAYGEIAEEQKLNYDTVRMKIGRCLDDAKSLVS